MIPIPDAVLLIAMRQIGDVLLITPLLRSLRRAWPRTRIDVLVFANKGGVLEGNPDCNEVISVSEKPDLTEYRHLARRIWRRYDLAVNTLAGDRPHLMALLAARQRIGPIYERNWKSLWKRAVNREWLWLDNVSTHTVIQNLALLDCLGITPCYEVVPPHDPAAETTLDALLPFRWREIPYAALHLQPNWRYKQWSQEGWRILMAHLAERGLRVVLTGGPNTEEMALAQAMAQILPATVTSLAGQVGFGVLSRLLTEAACYVGPDTAMTHLAAACGVPTLALYGPSNPVKWGPWPQGATADPSPWRTLARPWQRQGNVLLLQGAQPPEMSACLPCHEEGCDRHKGSHSRCLDLLSVEQVIEALDTLTGQSG